MGLSKNTIRQEITKLAALRIRKGISLAQIEEETRIRVEYLNAIEQGQFEKLPDGVYRINYLKQYAGQIDSVLAEQRQIRHPTNQTSDIPYSCFSIHTSHPKCPVLPMGPVK